MTEPIVREYKVKLFLYSSESGGRNHPYLGSKIRTSIRFSKSNDSNQYMAYLVPINSDGIPLGIRLVAILGVLHSGEHLEELKLGMNFYFYEGGHCVGEAEVVSEIEE
ncbi:hypothetical protein L2750_07670 [Shewanella submarina]|uniref:Nitrogen fixation protein NifZ n=1 Tax=Shewanella submarina TaxID=2016376 RepID=A0ABV7G7T6_9GAMM|nr:hypothetical protein [Shewanella submarina]MCL1037029.1 hypothetical protein [Shewanella submarina]